MFPQSPIDGLVKHDSGLIVLDEHTTVSCMIDEVTPGGLRLTLLDGSDVPGTFVLLVGAGMCVCSVVRRSDETIQAAFVEPAPVASAATACGGVSRLDRTKDRRPTARDRFLRQAA